MLNKLSSKKKRQINKNKRKTRIKETSSRKAIISNLEIFNKKELLVPIPATKISEPKVKDINIVLISTDAYCIACYLKKAQVFAVSIKDI